MSGRHSIRVAARPVVAVSILLGLSLLPLAINPIAYVKAVSIVEGPPPRPLSLSSKILDVQPFIREIPYQAVPRRVDVIDPAERYRQTIMEGQGYCSDMVKGMSYYLASLGVDYQIIHILPREHLLDGWGHTLIRAPLRLSDQTALGLVDILEGGILKSGNHYADYTDLATAQPVQILRLHPDRNLGWSNYSELLPGASVGYTSAHEANRFSNYLQRFYVPMQSAQLENAFYIGSSLMTGVYPAITVRSIEETFSPEDRWLRWFFLWCLWMSRLLLLLLLALCSAALCRLGARLFFREERRGPAGGSAFQP